MGLAAALCLLTGLICFVLASCPSTAGIEALVARRLPAHKNHFSFHIANATALPTDITKKPNDVYTVSSAENGSIVIHGNSAIALASGLHWYLSAICHVDIYWFLEPTLDKLPITLPRLNTSHHGSSVVPWRYHFNTVTFSYTSAFWSWEDWELQLDWMALRGINLPLAWNGYEKILSDVFLDAGFSETEISTFLSGPAFQAWNRFGNIQGSWGPGILPSSWIESQFDLNKKIVARMVELGMTPVLPAFTGFVPRTISRVAPDASYVDGDAWSGFSRANTNVTFLEPFDPLFAKLQESFIAKQQAAYGNVTHIYTLDQYNENDPYSGNLTYLQNVTSNTLSSLKRADPDAIWLLQGWLFYSSSKFWTNERIEAYLGGVSNASMLILDLFSESQPQWQRTNSYYGKPWIWCELHDYGGNQGMYGQIENVTINAIAALQNKTTTMIGMGLTMEGQEGNEIMYDLLLDQAWSSHPLDTDLYFHDWVTTRYGPVASLPSGLYKAWDLLRTTVFNNTNLENGNAVPKSIFELAPNVTGLLNRTGHHPTALNYNPTTLTAAWKQFYSASNVTSSLWSNDAYVLDLTDMTRQIMANTFMTLYTNFVKAANTSSPKTYDYHTARSLGSQMLMLLNDIDTILAASRIPSLSLSTWFDRARSWAGMPYNATDHTSYMVGNNMTTAQTAAYYEYNALNQLTLWGPTGQINDYASKQWSGLVEDYYVPRWEMFIAYTLNGTTDWKTGANAGLRTALLKFGENFDMTLPSDVAVVGTFQTVLAEVVGKWQWVFS